MDKEVYNFLITSIKKSYNQNFIDFVKENNSDLHINNEKLFITACARNNLEIAKFIYEYDYKIEFVEKNENISIFFDENQGCIVKKKEKNKNKENKENKTKINFDKFMFFLISNNSNDIIEWIFLQNENAIVIDKYLLHFSKIKNILSFEMIIELNEKYSEKIIIEDSDTIIESFVNSVHEENFMEIVLKNSKFIEGFADIINRNIDNIKNDNNLNLVKNIKLLDGNIIFDFSYILNKLCSSKSYKCFTDLFEYTNLNKIKINLEENLGSDYMEIIKNICNINNFELLNSFLKLLDKNKISIHELNGIDDYFLRNCRENKKEIVEIFNKYLDYYIIEYGKKKIFAYMMELDIYELKNNKNIEKYNFDKEERCLICLSSDEKYYINYNCNSKHNHYYCLECVSNYKKKECLICMKPRHIKNIKFCLN
jgi:hypothetical protein